MELRSGGRGKRFTGTIEYCAVSERFHQHVEPPLGLAGAHEVAPVLREGPAPGRLCRKLLEKPPSGLGLSELRHRPGLHAPCRGDQGLPGALPGLAEAAGIDVARAVGAHRLLEGDGLLEDALGPDSVVQEAAQRRDGRLVLPLDQVHGGFEQAFRMLRSQPRTARLGRHRDGFGLLRRIVGHGSVSHCPDGRKAAADPRGVVDKGDGPARFRQGPDVFAVDSHDCTA